MYFPYRAHLRIAKGWLGDDEVRKIAAKLLNKVKHVHTSRLLRRKNSLKLKENLTGWSPAPASKSRSIPSAPYCFQWATWSINELIPATHSVTLPHRDKKETCSAISSAASLLSSQAQGFGSTLYSYLEVRVVFLRLELCHPPTAKIIVVSPGTAPSVSWPLVIATRS